MQRNRFDWSVVKVRKTQFFMCYFAFVIQQTRERSDYRFDIVRGCVVVSMSVREKSLKGLTFTCMTKIAGV